MSSLEKFDTYQPAEADGTEAIDKLGMLTSMTASDRDGAIARHHNMVDPRTTMSWDRITTRAKKFIGGTALLSAIAAANYYSHDVMPERERVEHTHSSVTSTQESLDPGESGRGTVSFTGWGTMNAKNVVAALPYEEIGQEAYFSYDPAGISHKKNAEAVLQYATEHNVDRLVLHGSSMGGNMALKTAALLHEDEDAPAVEAIILDCSPLSADAVWPERRLAGDRMLQLTSTIPGAENSRMILGAAMMADRYNQYIDGTDVDWLSALKTARGVRQRITSGRDAPIELRNAQLRVILSEGTEDDIRVLSEEKNGKKPPHIFLLVPADTESDSTVNNVKSAEVLQTLAKKFGISISIIMLPPGTGHANPAQRPVQYSAALREQVFPTIERERLEAQAKKYAGKGIEVSQTTSVKTPPDVLAEPDRDIPLSDGNTPAG